jgi:hypothetical protein
MVDDKQTGRPAVSGRGREERLEMRMKKYWVMAMAAVLLAMTGPGLPCAGAEDMIEISHGDVFGRLRRPPVPFPHDLHMEALEDPGCGACHHSPDPGSGELVYIEGEELGCMECHPAEKQDDMPALREAYHGSCNACHRQRIRDGRMPSGPTTCGECHQGAH